ncbi:MAG TPA: hypothetical protein VFU04_09080 [Solirubrobacterales bacterium]|nr:hypothetical protein [Solirubrobacterales bacterium]
MGAFDRHEEAFARHDVAMAKYEKAMDRNGEVMDRVIAALDRHEAREDDFKVFIRDQNTRARRRSRPLFRRNDEFLAQEARRTDEIVAESQGTRSSCRAQTEALLRLIDRFPPPAKQPRG